MLLIAAPGQGAQAPGFLSAWLELPGFADRLGPWSELAGCDLIRCGSTAGADEIRDTAIAQPLLVAAAIATADELFGGLGQAARLAGAAAGHSVGELGAGSIAGVISPEDALRLVRVRGRAMARAAAAEPTGMTAVLGGNEKDVLAAIEGHGLTPANVNGAGQLVAAGTMAQLAAFAADPPARARLIPLSVAGAFHTRHMAPAVEDLRDAASAITAKDPRLVLLSNHDGAVVRSGTDWLERIVTQVSSPVRWDKCMQSMTGLGVSALVELQAARSLIAEHGQADADSDAPEWRLLVAPLAGIFRACSDGQPGVMISSGDELGHVEIRGGSHLVTPTFPATIIEWLVEDGDPVSAGQPLIRLLPAGTE